MSAPFFILEDPPVSQVAWWWLEPSQQLARRGEAVIFSIMDCEFDEQEPVPFKIMRGTMKPDVIGNTMAAAVWTRGLAEFLLQRGFKGIDARQVLVYNRSSQTVVDRDVCWIRTAIGAGAPDQTRGSALRYNKEFRQRNPWLQGAFGVFFDHSTWTGLDVFRLTHGSSVFVTTRVADAIRASSFSKLVLIDPSEESREERDRDLALQMKQFPHLYTGPRPPD